MATVVNPSLPYSAPLVNQLTVGSLLQFQGVINDEKGFIINLKTEEDDTALHFNPRCNEGEVVLNTKQEDKWANEERVACCAGLQPGQTFDLTILVESDKYMIGLNGEHYCHFNHRLKAKKVKAIEVKGSADFTLIREGTAFSSTPIINPSVPFKAFIPGGFQTERMLLVYGIASGDFSINLMCGNEEFKSVALHVNPRISAGTIVLNSTTCDGSWEAEKAVKSSLAEGHAFVAEIVNHSDVFEVRVNGVDLGEFPHRHPEEYPQHRINTLHICGNVQLHQVHF